MRWKLSFFLLLLLLVTGGIVRAQTWTAPTVAPPAGNLPPPLNTSAVEQKKDGPLTIQEDLRVGGVVKGIGMRVQVSGADPAYALELGQHGNTAAQYATGVMTDQPTLVFESADGRFGWWKLSSNALELSVGSATDPTLHPLNLQQGWYLQRNATRVRVVPGNAPTYALELGQHGNTAAQYATGVMTDQPTLAFESQSGAFQWTKQGNATILLSLNGQAELRVSNRLCLNTGSSGFLESRDCRNTWPSASSAASAETDTLAIVTDPVQRGAGANYSTADVPITIAGTLDVNTPMSIRAREFRLANGTHVVTSNDYGHFPSGTSVPVGVFPINADMVDGMHAADIITNASGVVAQQLGAGMQCGYRYGHAQIFNELGQIAVLPCAASGQGALLDSSFLSVISGGEFWASELVAQNGIPLGAGSYFLVGGGCDKASGALASTQPVRTSYPVSYRQTSSSPTFPLRGWACHLRAPGWIRVVALCCKAP